MSHETFRIYNVMFITGLSQRGVELHIDPTPSLKHDMSKYSCTRHAGIEQYGTLIKPFFIMSVSDITICLIVWYHE